MSVLTETFALSNGDQIPKIGFGTWLIKEGEECYNAVADALRVGYRHIDTARAYYNEASVGRAVRDSGIPREEIYVTSKLPAEAKAYDKALEEFETTMGQIGLDYLDLYLVHAPWPWNEVGKDCREENRQIWKAMEEFLASGRVKAIGVSNFGPEDLDSLLTASSSTIPRSPTLPPATASAHHNCVSATCCKRAPSCCQKRRRRCTSSRT